MAAYQRAARDGTLTIDPALFQMITGMENTLPHLVAHHGFVVVMRRVLLQLLADEVCLSVCFVCFVRFQSSSNCSWRVLCADANAV